MGWCDLNDVEKFCKFVLDCAYAHMESQTSKLEKTVIETLANIRVNKIELKDALQRLANNLTENRDAQRTYK